MPPFSVTAGCCSAWHSADDGPGHPGAILPKSEQPLASSLLGLNLGVVQIEHALGATASVPAVAVELVSQPASSAGSGSFSTRSASSLARVAYMSTYSCSDSRLISYMISSVMARRM